MRARDRQATLADWLDAEGRIDVLAAAERLGVAPETIRRDLRALEREGRLQRVHGGAIASESDPILALGRPATLDSEDHGWAHAVWGQLPRTGTILLGAGEPTLTLAKLIITQSDDLDGLTVVTNSLDAALVLSRAKGLSVYNIGGTVSSRTRAQEGDWALTELSRLHTDVSVVCPAGISVQHGLTQPTPAAAAVSEAEVYAGSMIIVLATPEALGTAALVQFAPIDRVDHIAVTLRVSDERLRPFREREIMITTAAGRAERDTGDADAIVGA